MKKNTWIHGSVEYRGRVIETQKVTYRDKTLGWHARILLDTDGTVFVQTDGVASTARIAEDRVIAALERLFKMEES